MKTIKPIFWILLLGLILRLISLNQSLWLDEAIEWWGVTSFSLKRLLTGYMLGDFHPPLHHLLIWFWVRVFGSSEISLRLPSVLFGLGTIYFTSKLAQQLKINPNFAALLIATAPLLIYYSQEARPYALAAFTVTAAVYYLLSQKRVLSVIFISLSLYSHYLTWLLLPVFIFLQPLSAALAVVSFAPFLPIFLNQLQQGTATAAVNPIWAQVVGSLSVKNTLLVPIKFLIGRLPVEANLFYALILFIPLCLAAYLILKAKHKLLYSWLFLPLALAAIIALRLPIFSYFRFLFVLPAFYLLITLGISQLPKKLRFYTFILFLVINLLSSGLYLLNPNFHRENWREAARYIHQTDLNSPVVIYSSVRSPFEYYNDPRHYTSVTAKYNRGQSLQLSEKNLNQLINQPAAWYISYAQPIFDPEQKVTTTLKQLGFEETSQRHFRGVTVIYYQNPTAKLFSKI